MINEDKLFLERAGFYLWANESWKPKGALVDWACNYDKQILELIDIVRHDERKKCELRNMV
jgi:hypothetical protein